MRTTSAESDSTANADQTPGGTVTRSALHPDSPTGFRSIVRGVWLAVVLDLVAIVVFVAIGRSSHEEGVTAAGMVSTAWPFLAGATLGWLIGRVWQRPTSLVPGALSVWLGTVVVGMALRVVAGQGTAVSFVIVACAFLGATLVGWRLVALGLTTARQRRTG